MAQYLHLAHDPFLAPGWTLLGHTYDEHPNLTPRVDRNKDNLPECPFRRDQPPVSAHGRVRGHDCGDASNEPATKRLPFRRQPQALIIGQPKPAPAKLLLQDSIFIYQILDRPLLFAPRPSSKASRRAGSG